jgi:hypothetical protein
MCGQLHAPVALVPGKDFPNPLVRGLDGPQSQFGHCGEEKNSWLCREPNPVYQSRSPSLFRKSSLGSVILHANAKQKLLRVSQFCLCCISEEVGGSKHDFSSKDNCLRVQLAA